jgi:hypothetical protein
MKTIAVMTMAFLPAAFFAALFAIPSLQWTADTVMREILGILGVYYSNDVSRIYDVGMDHEAERGARLGTWVLAKGCEEGERGE